MSITFSVFIATSLDGFIAREDGSLDWLPQPDGSPEDYGYADFMTGVDTLLMGRNTFEKVLTFGEWPYEGRRVVVLSQSLQPDQIPATLQGKLELVRGTLPEVLEYLESTRTRRVYVDGGKVIQSFLRAGLIDRLILTRIPVLLGRGIPLFGPLEADIPLEHIATVGYESGFVQSQYRIKRRM